MRAVRKLLFSLCLLAAAALGGPATANTIEIAACMGGVCGYLSDSPLGGNTFVGYTGVGTTSFTNATTFQDLPNSNPSSEATKLNALAGTSFSTSNSDYPANFNVVPSGTSFNVPALAYFLMKLDGPNGGWAFFQNITNTVLTLVYNETGRASGFSHYAIFGATAVPLPAGIGLLAAGLAGLGVVGWRKRRVSAAAA
jgi:hypothetical protein